jgi:hypothetical protein
MENKNFLGVGDPKDRQTCLTYSYFWHVVIRFEVVLKLFYPQSSQDETRKTRSK